MLSERSLEVQALLAKPYNDFLELLGPIALAFGCYKLSCNVRTIGQGPDRCGPPLTEVLSRFVDTAEHATVKRKGTQLAVFPCLSANDALKGSLSTVWTASKCITCHTYNMPTCDEFDGF